MALIKCIECGQDISTESFICPHCGKPRIPTSIKIKQAENIRATRELTKLWILVVIFIGGFGGFYLIRDLSQINHSYNYQSILNPPASPAPDKSKEISLQEVKNLGYDFYVGQIDSVNTVDITDDLKNQITKIAYDTHFPISLLKDIPIIILNNLALTGDQYIPIAGRKLLVPDLKPNWLSEGGIYDIYNSGLSVIFINKPIIAQGKLTEVLTHELGHAIGSKLTDQDWKKFYQLRNIPSATPRQGTNWNLSPQEDFAEVYKNTFTGIPTMTYYGLILPTNEDYAGIFEFTCGGIYTKIYNNKLAEYEKINEPKDCTDSWNYSYCILSPKTQTKEYRQQAENAAKNAGNTSGEIQSCRRDVILHQEKYPRDFDLGVPYKTTVSQSTKNFIVEIANRLNLPI